MQSAYLCNRAIREYEASDLNPTIAAILHLNPPTSSALLLFATRRGLLGFLAGIAFLAPNPEQVEKLQNAATWCGAAHPRAIPTTGRRARMEQRRGRCGPTARHGRGGLCQRRRHGRGREGRRAPSSTRGSAAGAHEEARRMEQGARAARPPRRRLAGPPRPGTAAPPPPQRHTEPPTAEEGRAATGGHGRRRAPGSGGQVHRAAPPRPPCRAAMATGGRGGARRPPDGEGGGGRLASPWPPRRRSSPPAAGRACRARRQLQGAAPVRARRRAPAPQPARERRRGPRRHSVCACIAAAAPAHARRWLAAAVRRPPRSLARTSRRAPAVARARGKGEGGARLAGSRAWLLGPATGRGRRRGLAPLARRGGRGGADPAASAELEAAGAGPSMREVLRASRTGVERYLGGYGLTIRYHRGGV